jgi:hypothetical protein
MFFLIGVGVLVGAYIIFRKDIKKIVNTTSDLMNMIKNERLKDEIEPKSLSSMDSIYLTQIKKDFPDININEMKREAEKIILDCFNAVEKKDSSGFKDKIKSFVDDMINDYSDKNIKFNKFKFHNTVVSNYHKNGAVATITFGSSFEYFLDIDGEDKRTQDRAKVEFIYVIDAKEVSANMKSLDLHCPNCNSPITNLGHKKCSYCGTSVVELIKRVFVCNDIKRY